MNTLQAAETAASIFTSLDSMPRVYRPEPEVLTLIDRMLWKPIEFETVEEYRATFESGTQLTMFHPCAHCGVGMSATINTHCNHCRRYLTRWMEPRDWWMQGWRRRLGAVLWVWNYSWKEARRDAQHEALRMTGRMFERLAR